MIYQNIGAAPVGGPAPSAGQTPNGSGQSPWDASRNHVRSGWFEPIIMEMIEPAAPSGKLSGGA